MGGQAINELAAGVVAGTFAIVPFHPIDTLKSRMQTRAAEYSNRPLSLFNSMVRREGLTSLYRGVASPMFGYGLINGSVFLSRGVTRDVILAGDARPLTLAEEAAVGASAGFWSSFARAPVERVKNVMQVRNSGGVHAPYTSSMACARALVRDLGFVKGLYTGFGSTVAREIPQYVFYFMAYDKSKELLDANHAALGISSHFVPVISGGIAGTMCWIPPFYSIDVIKTKIQSAPVGTYSGMADCVLKSYKSEGLSVFYRGMGLAVARAFLVHGSIFFLYEKTKFVMDNFSLFGKKRPKAGISLSADEGIEAEK